MPRIKHTLLFFVFRTLRRAKIRMINKIPVKIMKMMVTAVGPLEALII